MIEKVINYKLISIAIFLVIGYLSTYSFFVTPFGIFCIFYPLLLLYLSKNENEEVLTFAAFIAGGEVFFRMTGSFILYETGKYGIILFLLLAIFTSKSKNSLALQYVFYLFLLLLGILFTNVPEGESIRKAVAFNLSGPFMLGVCAIYFYQREITKEKLMQALFFAALPIFSMVSYLYFRTPDISEIVFGGAANFEASGGFGPNQVATAIGFGIFIITIFMVIKEKLTGYFLLDAFFLIYFVYRGLLTFSRGGLLTGLVGIGTLIFFYTLFKRFSFGVIFKYLFLTSAIITGLWIYTSNVTGGMINNRYTGKNASGVQKEDVSSGRGKIINLQFENFLDNPVGIGVGNGKYDRIIETDDVTAASHNEVGRLLEEHGYLGLLMLMILLIVPLFNFSRSNNFQRGFIISFYLFWFLTINHSAMRIAFPGFIYALSLINITNIDE